MGAVDDLLALRWTESLVKALFEEQKSLERLKKNCSSRKKGKYLEKRLENVQEKLAKEIESYIDFREEVIEILKRIDDGQIRCVLELRYVNYLSWEEIAGRLKFSKRHILRLNEKGLKMLEEIENGD